MRLVNDDIDHQSYIIMWKRIWEVFDIETNNWVNKEVEDAVSKSTRQTLLYLLVAEAHTFSKRLNTLDNRKSE